MLQGNWFNSAIVIVPGITPAVKPNHAKPLRFLRLVRGVPLSSRVCSLRAVSQP